MMHHSTKQYIIVANWKMYLNFYDSVAFCTTNKSSIAQFAKNHTLILLPAFVALSAVCNTLQDTDAFHGAQDCSEFDFGAHTGDISASMLAELGCSYCLIGHAERRSHHNETDEQIAKKFHLLLQAQITPILCVGTQHQQNIADVKHIIEKQLHILTIIAHTERFFVAYEPAWAISKKDTPFDVQYIQHVETITALIHTRVSNFKQAKILYGGSVDQSSICKLLHITHIDGFLIGKASSTFSPLKSIIDSL